MSLSSQSSRNIVGLAALLAGLSLPLFVGCAPKNGSQTPASPAQQTQQTQAQGTGVKQVAQGTGDSGGGNGIDNKVFEAYAFDITQTAEWREFIAPIEEKIVATNPKDYDGKGFLTVIARTLKWYIVPMKLNQIPKETIGLDITQDPIQQLALQTGSGEVWIERDAYNKGSAKDRATLILHETLMRFYQMQFMPLSELTRLAGGGESTATSENGGKTTTRPLSKEEIAYFDKLYPPRPKRALNKDDYANIRAMTQWLLTSHETISVAEAPKWEKTLWNEFMKYDFDPRFKKDTEADAQSDSIPGLKANEVMKIFSTARILGKTPSFCRKALSTAQVEPCAVQVEAMSEVDRISKLPHLQVTLKTQGGETQKFIFDVSTETGLGDQKVFRNGEATRMKVLFMMPHLPAESKVGDRAFGMLVYFSGSIDNPTIEAIELVPYRITEINAGGQTASVNVKLAKLMRPDPDVDPELSIMRRADDTWENSLITELTLPIVVEPQ